MSLTRARCTLAAIACAITLPSFGTVLDFEAPLPGGLVPVSYVQDTPVGADSRVTDQYLAYGLRVADAALVAAGLGHAASGINALAGVNAGGTIDYDQPVVFTFFLPGDGSVAGTTDYFAYSPDLGGGSGNVITISAFDPAGSLLGQTNYVETGVFHSPLWITGVGQFHRVTVDQTLYMTYSGGIALDLVTYGEISAAVPEPESYLLMLAGLAAIALLRRQHR